MTLKNILYIVFFACFVLLAEQNKTFAAGEETPVQDEEKTIVKSAKKSASEFKLKAAYIYNFIQSIDSAQHEMKGTPNLCVLGQLEKTSHDDFVAFFDAISDPGKKPRLQFKNHADENIEKCQILFIADSEAVDLTYIISSLNGKPVLTISDIRNFTQQGGMIGFVLSDEKMKFVVNKISIDASNLTIDPQLLDLALSVIK